MLATGHATVVPHLVVHQGSHQTLTGAPSCLTKSPVSFEIAY
jgi:hypothetical protein